MHPDPDPSFSTEGSSWRQDAVTRLVKLELLIGFCMIAVALFQATRPNWAEAMDRKGLGWAAGWFGNLFSFVVRSSCFVFFFCVCVFWAGFCGSDWRLAWVHDVEGRSPNQRRPPSAGFVYHRLN